MAPALEKVDLLEILTFQALIDRSSQVVVYAFLVKLLQWKCTQKTIHFFELLN